MPEGRAREPTRLEAFEQAVAAAWATDRLLATFLTVIGMSLHRGRSSSAENMLPFTWMQSLALFHCPGKTLSRGIEKLLPSLTSSTD